MPQLNYRQRLAEGLPGKLASSALSADILSAINDDPRAQQIVTFTVDENAETGDLSIQGVTFEGAGADENAVAADLADNINEEPLVNGTVTAEADDDDVIVTAKVGGVGFLFDDGTNTTAAETQANATAASVPFGRAVLLAGEGDEGDMLAKLMDENEVGDILGVSVYTATFEKGRSTNPFDRIAAEYPGGSVLNVLREGRIYVETEGEVSVGDDVYVRHTADGDLDELGGFAGASGTGLVELTSARWHKGTNAEGLAVLQVNFD